MNTITNKLQDLQRDVERRDAVALRMHFHELAVRGLCDDELDELSLDLWSGHHLQEEEAWERMADRLGAMSLYFESEP